MDGFQQPKQEATDQERDLQGHCAERKMIVLRSAPSQQQG
jgi:hypothetical protein